jgi:hypothetical protein
MDELVNATHLFVRGRLNCFPLEIEIQTVCKEIRNSRRNWIEITLSDEAVQILKKKFTIVEKKVPSRIVSNPVYETKNKMYIIFW